MKGVIAACLGELVVKKFGKEKWTECLVGAGLPGNTSFMPHMDVPDEDVLKVVNSTCKVLNMTLSQAADAFGDFWVNEYAPKIYGVYYLKPRSAKEFLLNMDEVHEKVTKTIPKAHPPRFDYEWKDEKTLVMTYKSRRRLVDFLVGLIKGVGRRFKENLRVTKLGPQKVQVVFQ